MILKNIQEPDNIEDNEFDDWNDFDNVPVLSEETAEQLTNILSIEENLGLKHRPRLPDVFNNVSINTPYYINLKEKKVMFAEYETNHTNALKTFNDISLLYSFNCAKYGWDKPFLYFYDGRHFNNALELELYMWAVDHNIEIERCPGYMNDKANGISQSTMPYPDFRLGDKFICIEPKFMKKDNGSYNCCYPVKELIDMSPDSIEDQMNERKKDVLASYPTCEFWDEDKFEEISDWIYHTYSDDWLPLFINYVPFPWPNDNLRDTSPMGLVRHFHKSIFEARHGHEPTILELWNDKKVFKDLALNRLLYVGECGLDRMRQGYNIAKTATKVSVFKSTVAIDLIKKYLWDAKNIFDPFSGFSGRMLGAMICHVPYIGRDVNAKHIKESKAILDWWKTNRDPKVQVDLAVADATRNSGIYDCLLTCSPYATIDKYGNRKNIEDWNNPNQLALTCDEWIDVCLMNYKCRKYVFVVDDTIVKYRPNVVGVIGNKGHMGRNKEYIVFLDFTNYSLPMFDKGVSPYDINKEEKFHFSNKGVSPFDVPLLTPLPSY